jgi:hypothetical protein
VTDVRGKFYAPDTFRIQADDSNYPGHQKYEAHYFHCISPIDVHVPKGKISIVASHGPLYDITKMDIEVSRDTTIVIQIKKLSLPADFGSWRSGDLHVHMNYGGIYLNTPANLVEMAQAEDLNFVYNWS